MISSLEMNSSLLALFLIFFFFVSSSSSARKFLFIRVPRFRLPSCCLLIDGLIFCALSRSLSLFLLSLFWVSKTLIHPINSCASACLRARLCICFPYFVYLFVSLPSHPLAAIRNITKSKANRFLQAHN